MKKHYILVALLSVYVLTGCDHHKSDVHDAAHNEVDLSATPAELKLTPQFQDVLKKEMQEIQAAMQVILPLLTKGESEKTAKLADQIHSSFILRQTLSPEELKELVQLLPARFIKMDRAFHAEAAKLATAAREGDFKKSAEIYGVMVNACVSCHTQFAQEQFPDLNRQQER
ncbi:MAG: hypothetical protein DWQ10_17045 [Calditrichaeota bacterium]|nr:MAG: hypothetical protein DWQ10_17045 [Calditrichota bacterium]